MDALVVFDDPHSDGEGEPHVGECRHPRDRLVAAEPEGQVVGVGGAEQRQQMMQDHGAGLLVGVQGVAAAAPSGPCQNVTYVGVCERLGDQPRTPPQQARGEVILAPNNIQNFG